MLTIGSLATGYGGLDLAVERLTGAKTVWVSEVDPGACAILEYRFPGVPNLGDFTRAYWARVPHVDIFTAGYPCQPFSHAGRRKGTDDERHLWPYIATAILALRPRLVVLENVAGHLSLGFGDVLGDLAAVGYDAEWVSLRAADVGACHGRRRVFIAAYPRGEAVGLWPGLCAGLSSGLGRGRSDDGGVPARVLPTPTVRDSKGHNQRRDDTCLTGALPPTPRATRGGSTTETMALLPTPSASNPNDDEDLTTWQDRRARVKETAGNGNGFGTPLGVAVRLLSDTPSQPAETHEWMMGYLDHGEAPDSVPGQDLRELWQDVQPEAVQRATGGPGALPEPSELLSGMREHEGGCEAGHAALAGQEASRGDVRGVRDAGGLARPSHRPERGEQQAPEPADALLVLPPEAPLAGGSGEAHGVQPDGCGCAAWGQYAPAVHSHERLVGRAAPAPTEEGPSGKPRLSARAVEWMMCLPAGWVTDPAIWAGWTPSKARNAQLKALGNGVVPPQAIAALRWLLDMSRLEVAA